MNETMRLAARIANANYQNIPHSAVEASKQAIMDFVGVTLAGIDEPLAKILRADAADQGGHNQANVIGTQEQVSVQQAALVNGSAGHAHDYDDVHMAMSGHPTVPVAPVVFALAQHMGCSGQQIINAFATGVDTECIIGRYVGASHYQQGWHATGTLGTFGAAAAAASLLNLKQNQTAMALGIAGTQAAGLKSQFGTMCKPLHAGHAASTGLGAALLAARGFDSRDNILEADQGFLATQSTTADPDKFDRALKTPAFAQDICFKYHAACYLTHSAIEATRALCSRREFSPNDIRQITVTVDPGHFKVCNIQEPQSGLEAKFSLRFTVAMTLAGIDTAAIDSFTSELTQDPQLVNFRDMVRVVASTQPTPDTHVKIETTPGGTHATTYNVAIPLTDLELQWQKLTSKFRAVASPRISQTQIDELIHMFKHLETMDDLGPLFDAVRAV